MKMKIDKEAVKETTKQMTIILGLIVYMIVSMLLNQYVTPIVGAVAFVALWGIMTLIIVSIVIYLILAKFNTEDKKKNAKHLEGSPTCDTEKDLNNNHSITEESIVE